MPRKIRVGVLGSGGIAQGKHVPGHLGVSGVELFACCDIDEKRAKAFAARNGIRHVFTSHDDLVTIDELDAVSVAHPTCSIRRPPSPL